MQLTNIFVTKIINYQENYNKKIVLILYWQHQYLREKNVEKKVKFINPTN